MNKRFRKDLLLHMIIILGIMVIALRSIASAQKEDETLKVDHLSSVTEDVEIESVNAAGPTQEFTIETETKREEETEEQQMYPRFQYSKDWDAEDSFLLAKIAMAEAEGCNIQTKTLVILTVLNRVWSDEFPGTIEDVIFQPKQFSPINNGRWDRVYPNEDCYEAVRIVMQSEYDYSGGCLYFESCENEDNWHNRNLQFLFESEGIRFYK